jgi:hypothetical protein
MYEDETERVRIQEIAAVQEIKAAFVDYFGGNTRATVPYALGAGGVALQTCTEAIGEMLSYGEPLQALTALLTGSGDVKSLQHALVAGYVRLHADSVASERAAWEAPAVHSFLFKEAA